MKQKPLVAKKKSRRRSRSQAEADRRLTCLRKNLAKEIEADFDRFSGDKPSIAAGLMVLARMRIILAFLQAFFPMFISAPKPRKIKKEGLAKRRKRGTRARSGSKSKSKIKSKTSTVRKKVVKKKVVPARKPKGLRVVKLQQEDAGVVFSARSGAEESLENIVTVGNGSGKTGSQKNEAWGVSSATEVSRGQNS